MALKRRIAFLGKRVVIVTSAPSRKSLSAIYIPIFARPPVSKARRPVKSTLASRRWRLSCAQVGHNWWWKESISVYGCLQI